ncbi:hypothetical protein GHT06_011780 [Daphnia sinensis]|uniref:Ionotropic glutamate receptor C-terminal domain-containing protein n=1 Tax=Daphnia sinensis TaxID=1820382 RepID=A0AAD5LEL8_9CRUS|nr:hypothetical protein GHT06_011780 [Daphnia sinensis]
MARKFPWLSFAFLVFNVFVFASAANHKVGEVEMPRHQFRNGLQGKELRVVTGHFPPVISILKNSSGHTIGHDGLLYHNLLYLSEKLKFTFKIFAPPENTNGVLRNGTWNGVIGILVREEADLGLGPFAISLERYQGIEFCGRVGGDNTCILVRYPEGSISLTSAFDVFSTEIWIGWIVSGIVIVAVSVVTSVLAKRLWTKDRKMNAETIAWYLYGVIVSQGSYFPQRQLPQRLLLATWCFVAFVFVNIYNSTLTSYLSVTFQRPEVNSLNDLARIPAYKATILAGSIQEIDFQRTIDETGQTVVDMIQKCGSDCRKFTFQEMVAPVAEQENYVSIMPCSIAIAHVKKYNAKGNNCILTLAYEIKSWKPMFYAVPKSSPYIEEINRESLWFIDVGLRAYWYDEHEKQPEKCKLQYNSKGVSTKRFSKRIKLQQFYLPFLILFSGYMLAFFQFCREKLFYRARA